MTITEKKTYRIHWMDNLRTIIILIGVFGTLLLNTGLPVLVKYPLLFLSTYIGSNLLVSTYYAVKQAFFPEQHHAHS